MICVCQADMILSAKCLHLRHCIKERWIHFQSSAWMLGQCKQQIFMWQEQRPSSKGTAFTYDEASVALPLGHFFLVSVPTQIGSYMGEVLDYLFGTLCFTGSTFAAVLVKIWHYS